MRIKLAERWVPTCRVWPSADILCGRQTSYTLQCAAATLTL